jgi:hypothetical protein
MTDEETIQLALVELRNAAHHDHWNEVPNTYLMAVTMAAEEALQRLVAKGRDAAEAWRELWASQSSH